MTFATFSETLFLDFDGTFLWFVDREIRKYVFQSARWDLQLIKAEQRAPFQPLRPGVESHLAKNAWKAFESIEILPTAIEMVVSKYET